MWSRDVVEAAAFAALMAARLSRAGFPYPQTAQSKGEWTLLVFRFARAAMDLEMYPLASLLYRLSWRIYWPNRKAEAKVDDFMVSIAVALAVNCSRLGLPISGEFIKEVQSTGADAVEMSSYDWWPAPGEIASGRYSAALQILNLSRPQSLGDGTSRMQTPSLLAWMHHSAGRLGELEAMEIAESDLWHLRSLEEQPSYDERLTWLTRLGERAEVELARGLVERASMSFHALLKGLEGNNTQRARRLRISAEIRALLIESLPDSRAAELSEQRERVRCLLAEAKVDELRRELKAEGLVAGDKDFARYLGIEWRQESEGLGMFSGVEFPSPRRLALADSLTYYAEIILRSGQADKLLEIVDGVHQQLLEDYDETDGSSFLSVCRLAYCAPIALCSAMRAKVLPPEEKQEWIERALRHRQADVQENGSGRSIYYKRVFDYCGI